MARITVLGGTGYAGGHVVREAAARGHEVTVVARHAPADEVENVTYTVGNVLVPGVLSEAVLGADVVIEALAPRGVLEGKVRDVVRTLAAEAQAAGVRLGVVGGAGSLEVAPGGPLLLETDAFPDAFKAEAQEMTAVLADLRASDEQLDWFYVSPAGGFGAYAPGEHTGTFRLGGNVLLVDDDGASNLSGADFAQALVDEIETAAHRRERFTVAY